MLRYRGKKFRVCDKNSFPLWTIKNGDVQSNSKRLIYLKCTDLKGSSNSKDSVLEDYTISYLNVDSAGVEFVESHELRVSVL